MWLFGVVTDFSGFLCEAAALAVGSLAVVEPLIVVGLPLALVIGGLWARRPLQGRDWAGVGAVTIGIAVFLAVASPTRGRDFAPASRWWVAGVATVVVAGVALGVTRLVPHWRATLYATATGMVFAFSAAITKSAAALVKDHGIGALAHWEPYALAVVGVVSMVMSQSAFQAGELRASLPALTLVPPMGSLLFATTLFSEHVDTRALPLAVALVGAAVASVGVISLGHSRLVDVAYASGDDTHVR